jgi:hypothetical protein
MRRLLSVHWAWVHPEWAPSPESAQVRLAQVLCLALALGPPGQVLDLDLKEVDPHPVQVFNQAQAMARRAGQRAKGLQMSMVASIGREGARVFLGASATPYECRRCEAFYLIRPEADQKLTLFL